MIIVFIHSNIGQFKLIHQHIADLKGYQSHLICSENAYNKHKNTVKNLVPFKPHGGKLQSVNGFFYLKKLEQVNRRSISILKAIKINAATSYRFDCSTRYSRCSANAF